jgi:hypothetical protein
MFGSQVLSIVQRNDQMAAKNLGWREAILEVLKTAPGPLHYTDIAEAIRERELRSDLGSTPANSVAATITLSLQKDEEKSPFVRLGHGIVALRQKVTGEYAQAGTPQQIEESDETGLINAFGMYWSREKVLWATNPKILGRQQPGANPVDFCGQTGVYLLHQARSVVYVGRTTDQPLGKRLAQHTSDRLDGRWDRFSWFGVYPVGENGTLQTMEAPNFTLESLIVTMEALLIEGLEPPQNRKRGDEFRAIEYLQVEDPAINRNKIVALMDELKSKL